MPNEITELLLRRRLATVLQPYLAQYTATDQVKVVDAAYSAGNFSDFVGIVGKAVGEERQRAANTARRLGHPGTAAVILRGA